MILLWFFVGAVAGFFGAAVLFASSDSLYTENRELKETVKRLKKELDSMERWKKAFQEQLSKYWEWRSRALRAERKLEELKVKEVSE